MSLLIADHDGIRRITLNRPEKRNALDTATIAALIAALSAAAGEDAVRAVVIAGNGVLFSAGGDLAEMRAPSTPEQKAARGGAMRLLFTLPATLRLPVIAAVQGGAVGAGAALAMGCDAVVMADDAWFAWPEAKHRILPYLVGPPLAARVPRGVAFDLLATGRKLPAAEAQTLGLVARVVPAAMLEAEALRLAEEAASMPPEMMLAVKRMITP